MKNLIMKSRKVLLFAILFSMSSLVYGAKLIEGSFECLKGEKYLTIKLDCSKTVYKKGRPFEEFLRKAPRMDGWEEESIKYFCSRFNERTYKIQLTAILTTSKNTSKYELVIVPFKINGGGSIEGKAYLIDSATQEKLATIEIDVEGDGNDEIALRDPMKDCGTEIGKMVYKALK